MIAVILALLVSLACRVNCNLTGFSDAAASSYVPAATDSRGFNSGVASAIKWSPGTEGLHRRIEEGTACELEYNKREGEMTVRRTIRGRQEKQEAVMIAPSQPRMQRTVYSEDEMRRIAQGVGGLLNGKNSNDSTAGGLVPTDESDQGVFGYCGQIKVYDSENPDQLLLQNCSCEASKALKIRCHCDGCSSLFCVISGAIAVCWIFAPAG
ncbi:uncharacterized protein MELLADRAFT_109349 [Melampsora larici-populina 98AG31]|uniref:Secreted protein n=1 Tax=Melampsora larici-populina (strain 98AG31 / pathotype 3-4-7) TaxID=747676 RepID=F4RW64_MELLP|nr:uncharacterized protein MELLADRAFT_109349 [Melampsora larici-populina 98AG31]EGG03226.1 secreted protein [Melampsora larici-populina 98AG31]